MFLSCSYKWQLGICTFVNRYMNMFSFIPAFFRFLFLLLAWGQHLVMVPSPSLLLPHLLSLVLLQVCTIRWRQSCTVCCSTSTVQQPAEKDNFYFFRMPCPCLCHCAARRIFHNMSPTRQFDLKNGKAVLQLL